MINFEDISDIEIRKICNSYKNKILKKNKFQYFLRMMNLLKRELVFFIQKLFKKSSIQSNQRIQDYNIHWSKFNFEIINLNLICGINTKIMFSISR